MRSMLLLAKYLKIKTQMIFISDVAIVHAIQITVVPLTVGNFALLYLMASVRGLFST